MNVKPRPLSIVLLSVLLLSIGTMGWCRTVRPSDLRGRFV